MGTLGFVAFMGMAGNRDQTLFTWMLFVIGSFPLLSWLFMAPLLRRAARAAARGNSRGGNFR
jgi:amino acid permease